MKKTKLCSVENCNSPHLSRGYCSKHYSRFKNNGDPNVTRRAPSGEPLNWIHNIAKSHAGDDCIDWPYAHNSNGYGSVLYKGKVRLASRVMCEIIHGEVNDTDIEAAHTCGNGHLGCLNPRHIRWATRKENQADRLLHGTHNRGERCGLSVLNRDDVYKIKSLLKTKTQSAIAKQFGVAPNTIWSIKKGRSWGWMVSDGE